MKTRKLLQSGNQIRISQPMELQDPQLIVFIVGASLVVAGLIGFSIADYSRRKEQKSHQSNAEELTLQLDDFRHQLNRASTELALERQRIEQLQERMQELSSEKLAAQGTIEQTRHQLHRAETDIRQFQVELQKERQHSQEKLEQLEKNREQLKKEFESLAQQILKSSQQEFSEQSREKLGHYLQPFRQQLSDFRSKVEVIHTNDLKQREELKTELKHLQQLNLEMTQEAHQLSTALKGQKKTQGNWGELILENVLDRSGLRADQDYRREVSFSTEDGRKRPDVVVYLPEDKHLVIDAKVSLNAYTRYVNAEDDIERAQALKDHVDALSARIKELSDKHYFELPGLKSPEMVFMFIPIESAFVEAMRNDERLFQDAIEKQVLVATPTTLLTSLNIVRQLWRFEDQNKYAAKLSEQAAKVYNQLRLFLESMQALGYQLDKSKASYDKAMNQFMSGRGNLIKKVEDFQKLGVSVQTELPKEMVEKARLELDLIEHAASDVGDKD